MPQQLDHPHSSLVCVCVCVCVCAHTHTQIHLIRGHCSGHEGVRGAVSGSMNIADTLLEILLLIGERELCRPSAA